MRDSLVHVCAPTRRARRHLTSCTMAKSSERYGFVFPACTTFVTRSPPWLLASHLARRWRRSRRAWRHSRVSSDDSSAWATRGRHGHRRLRAPPDRDSRHARRGARRIPAAPCRGRVSTASVLSDAGLRDRLWRCAGGRGQLVSHRDLRGTRAADPWRDLGPRSNGGRGGRPAGGVAGPRAELAAALARDVHDGDVVLTLGAGDITKTGPELLELLRARGKLGRAQRRPAGAGLIDIPATVRGEPVQPSRGDHARFGHCRVEPMVGRGVLRAHVILQSAVGGGGRCPLHGSRRDRDATRGRLDSVGVGQPWATHGAHARSPGAPVSRDWPKAPGHARRSPVASGRQSPWFQTRLAVRCGRMMKPVCHFLSTLRGRTWMPQFWRERIWLRFECSGPFALPSQRSTPRSARCAARRQESLCLQCPE